MAETQSHFRRSKRNQCVPGAGSKTAAANQAAMLRAHQKKKKRKRAKMVAKLRSTPPSRHMSPAPCTSAWWAQQCRQQGEIESNSDDGSTDSVKAQNMRIKAVRTQIQKDISKEIEWTNFLHVCGAQTINDNFYTLWNHKEERMKTLWRAAIMKEFTTLKNSAAEGECRK